MAIGAPYEENTGAVYIFLGSPYGLIVESAQKILGKDIDINLRGFGISISKPADIDYNKYDGKIINEKLLNVKQFQLIILDVAIGAYLSGHTVLLRSRPIVILQHSIEPLIKLLDLTIPFFKINICMWFLSVFPPENISTITNIYVLLFIFVEIFSCC